MPGNAIPMSGPMMMLRALGFDPAQIQEQIETAKKSMNEVMTHFDMRLQLLETQNEKILLVLHSILKAQEQPADKEPAQVQ
jgi:hypothetical protein